VQIILISFFRRTLGGAHREQKTSSFGARQVTANYHDGNNNTEEWRFVRCDNFYEERCLERQRCISALSVKISRREKMATLSLSFFLSFSSFFLFPKSVHESRPKMRPRRLYRAESRRAVARKKLWQGSDDISGASGNFSAAGLRAFRIAVLSFFIITQLLFCDVLVYHT